jgi:hypothetical protein
LLIIFPSCLAFFFNSEIKTQRNYLESCRDIERGERAERDERAERAEIREQREQREKENNDDRERGERAISL